MLKGYFRRGFIALPLLVLCTFLSAAELNIKVLDAATSQPLDDASVSISGTASARLQGASVSFKDLESGDYVMKAEAPSYESKAGKIKIDNAVKTSYSGSFKLNKKKVQVPVETVSETPAESPASLFSWQEPDPVPANGTSMRTAQQSKKKASEILDAAGISVPQENIAPFVFGTEKKQTVDWKSYTVVFVVLAAFFMMASFILIMIFVLRRKSLSSILKVLLLTASFICDLLLVGAIIAALACHQSGGVSPSLPEPAETTVSKAQEKVEAVQESAQDQHERSREAASLYKLGTSILRNPALEVRSEEFDKAVSMLEDAFVMAPDNDIYALDLADAYIRNSTTMSVGLASVIYEGMLDRLPENDMILARLADSYARLSRYDDALKTALRRTWNKNISPLNAASQIVLFSTVSGEPSRGVELLIPLVSKFPAEAPQLKLMIAGLLAEDANKDGALALIDSILKELPETEPFTKEVLKIRKEVESK